MQKFAYFSFHKNEIMKKLFLIVAFVLVLISGLLFIMDQKTNIIRNMKVKTLDQIKEDEIKYSFKNSPFYKSYYSKKGLVVLNVWATWCKPCIEEIPKLNDIKSKIDDGNSSINFLSFSIDTDTIKLKKFNSLSKFNYKDITLENYLYKNSIFESLNVSRDNVNTSFISISSQEVPITYIIKNGIVVYKKEGSIDFKEFLKKLNSFK